ncbi:cupin domain-containing protein [Spirosoma sp. KUDC1026]|uniref:cupin domain-containing protein n=1 Tax=Spirosoma sp. KUDC1026 TaxID=2745947 RepID=UPI00159B85A6|nr:cupin domain-containing protein [Spirosoma sp. KUDC1026]QKZ13558.1 cupin domain-containing protein [Spirosoma sp. KUDC1026]
MPSPVSTGNLYAAIPNLLPEELMTDLLTGGNFRVERIVSQGQASPPDFWYDQAESEWVVVLQGEARLRLEGDDHDIYLVPGTYINIPAHVRHRVTWTKEDTHTVWLAIFYTENA